MEIIVGHHPDEAAADPVRPPQREVNRGQKGERPPGGEDPEAADQA